MQACRTEYGRISEEMPRSEGITTQSHGVRQKPYSSSSEEMPRSEGITTYEFVHPFKFGHQDPRKCPDQRGLRLDAFVYFFNSLFDPRKCPDQRGLRLLVSFDEKLLK